jgi:hypothetical protein
VNAPALYQSIDTSPLHATVRYMEEKEIEKIVEHDLKIMPEGREEDTQEAIEIELRRLYEKKADWAERFALALFASLVLGQIVQGVPFTQMSVLVGAGATTSAYVYANHLLNKSK